MIVTSPQRGRNTCLPRDLWIDREPYALLPVLRRDCTHNYSEEVMNARLTGALVGIGARPSTIGDYAGPAQAMEVVVPTAATGAPASEEAADAWGCRMRGMISPWIVETAIQQRSATWATPNINHRRSQHRDRLPGRRRLRQSAVEDEGARVPRPRADQRLLRRLGAGSVRQAQRAQRSLSTVGIRAPDRQARRDDRKALAGGAELRRLGPNNPTRADDASSAASPTRPTTSPTSSTTLAALPGVGPVSSKSRPRHMDVTGRRYPPTPNDRTEGHGTQGSGGRG